MSEETRYLGAEDGRTPPLAASTVGVQQEPLQADFAAQQRHLQRLVVSLDAALGSLLFPGAPQATSALPASSKPHRRSPAAASAAEGGKTSGAISSLDSKGTETITPGDAAALAAEALAAVKVSLALAGQYDHEDASAAAAAAASGGDQDSKNAGEVPAVGTGGGGARELRVALARAIGALRNACVGAASSTAELLGGEDPTGFAQVSWPLLVCLLAYVYVFLVVGA